MDNLPGGQAHKYFVTSSHWVRFTFRSLAKQNKKNLLDTTSPKRTVIKYRNTAELIIYILPTRKIN